MGQVARAAPRELAAQFGLRLAAEIAPGTRPLAPGLPAERVVAPATEDVARLLPRGGLVDAVAVAAGGVGSTSLLWRLLAGPTSAGRWCAVVGIDGLYPLASRAAGVRLDRLALVEATGDDVVAALGALVGALPVVVAPTDLVTPRRAQRIHTRLRRSGGALIWWERRSVPGVDARLAVTGCEWLGLRANEGRRYGAGRITGCRLRVDATWRDSRTRTAELRPYGGAESDPIPLRRR